MKDVNRGCLKACRGQRGVNRQQSFFMATRWLHKISACMYACMSLLLNMEE